MAEAFRLTVLYDADHYPELDDKIIQVTGKWPESSGIGGFKRDLEFSFETLDQCRTCKRLLETSDVAESIDVHFSDGNDGDGDE